jgi:hypothetical protein
VASAHDKGLWQTARAFALVNMGLIDGLIALFDTKYHYSYWRPYTAIREIDDGRTDTVMDPAWQPLLDTPPYPEHSSAQAVTATAAAYVLQRIYGRNVGFTITSTTAQPPGSTRTFANFAAAVDEGADSRIWGGIHFRSATGALARKQGEWVGRFLVRPLPEAGGGWQRRPRGASIVNLYRTRLIAERHVQTGSFDLTGESR